MARAFAALAFLAACSASPPPVPVRREPPAPEPAPPPDPPRASAPPFLLATDCTPATKAAADVLAEGGNAADATIVAVLVAGLAHPSASGLGGGGVALLWDASDRKATALDFRIEAPDPLPDRIWSLRDGEPTGVAGELAGLAHLQRRASLPWRVLVDRAVAVGEAGLVVSPYLARAFAQHPAMATAFGVPTQNPAGKPLSRPKLLATLKELASMDAEVPSTLGSADYTVQEPAPLSSSRGGLKVVTVPTAGGFVLWQSLQLVEEPPADPVAARHRLAEAFTLSVEDRMRHAGHAGTLPLEAAHVEKRRALLDPSRHRPISYVDRREGGTTNVVVVDAEGDAVVWSSSLGHSFGAQRITADGVVANDGLTSFARPAERRRFGDANAPAAGERPAVSLAPTLLIRDGELAFAMAASGGEHIPTALAQTVLRLDDSPWAEVTLRTRLRTPIAGGLWLEPEDEPHATGLRALGHHVRTDVPNLSAVVIVGVEDHRAAVDPRKGGATAISVGTESGPNLSEPGPAQ